jgi:ElaB/YqjD/DUF883 family membrane-anchored ribosome-binding protein
MEAHFDTAHNSQTQLARERVMTDLRTLARDAEDLLKATAGDATDKVKEVRARLTSALERARASCDELQAQGIESARAAARRADETIRSHPYESIGVAFGVGVLLGVLIKRS